MTLNVFENHKMSDWHSTSSLKFIHLKMYTNGLRNTNITRDDGVYNAMQHYGIYDIKWTRSLDHPHPISQSSQQTSQPSLIIKSSSTTGCKGLRVNGRQLHCGVCLNLGPWRWLTITTSLHFSPEWCGNHGRDITSHSSGELGLLRPGILTTGVFVITSALEMT